MRRSISSVAEKIQEIVDAAERVAREIETEAEANATRYREERLREVDALAAERAARLNELSTSLGEHAERVRADVISLSAELSRAADELRGPLHEAKPPESEPSSDADRLTDGTSLPEEALLRATQMFVAGRSREEIESALRDEFGLTTPAAVTNNILGQAKAS